jgi:hypothetical protein
MSVYVDSMKAKFGRMIMCHMNADTTDELLAMADRIGVKRRWLQKAGTYYEHFDICMAKRAQAVKCGAVEIDLRQAGQLLRRKRAEAGLPPLSAPLDGATPSQKGTE